jgi:hypothetical protein
MSEREWTTERIEAAEFSQERVDQISLLIQPYLRGLHPGEQGAILADLLALWLSGFPTAIRERLIDAHVRGVRQLIPLYEELRAQKGLKP